MGSGKMEGELGERVRTVLLWGCKRPSFGEYCKSICDSSKWEKNRAGGKYNSDNIARLQKKVRAVKEDESPNGT